MQQAPCWSGDICFKKKMNSWLMNQAEYATKVLNISVRPNTALNRVNL